MDNYIEITGCNLIALVKKAYALSRPQGLGHLHYREGELSDEQAQQIINTPGGIDMDYVHGRAVKFWVKYEGDRMFVPKRWYDHTDAQLRELLTSVGIQMPAPTN